MEEKGWNALDTFLHNPQHSSERLWQSVQAILEETALCSLATVDARGGVHVNTAFFAWTPDLVLYFLSDPASQHGRNLAQTPAAAVTVFDSRQAWGAPHRGLQLAGAAGPVPPAEVGAAEGVYRSRFRRYAEYQASAQEVFMALRLYRFRAERLQILDEDAFGMARPVVAEVQRREA